MTFLGSQDLAEASVEDVCDEGESINCFFRLRDGRELFVDTNWENINAPMFRDFTRPEFQGTTRWNAADIQPLHCQDANDGGLESQSELSQGCLASSAALPTSPAVNSCGSFEGACDSSAEVVSALNRHGVAPSNAPVVAQQPKTPKEMNAFFNAPIMTQQPNTPKETKAFRAHCVNQAFIPLNMQSRPSMPAIDHSLPEQVAQEWSEASLSAITPGLQELPSATNHNSPQASAHLTFCASQLAKSQSATAAGTSRSQPGKNSPMKPQPHLPKPKPKPVSSKPRVRGPSPLASAHLQSQLQSHRAQHKLIDAEAPCDILQSHAISLSQSGSNASTAHGQVLDMHASLTSLTATASGGFIPVAAGTEVNSLPSSTPSSATPSPHPLGKIPSACSPQRSRSVTTKATPSSRSNTKAAANPSQARPAAPSATAAKRQGSSAVAPAASASCQRPAGAGKVPAIDVSKHAADEGGEARTDTPSPSGLTVKQKIKWHETAVAPEGGVAAVAGATRLKRSQSARPALQVPNYAVRCAATAAPRCRPDPPPAPVTSYPIDSPVSRTRSQPAPQRHKFKPIAAAAAPASEKTKAESRTVNVAADPASKKVKGIPGKPYAVVTPRVRPPPPVHTAPVASTSPDVAEASIAAYTPPQASSLRQLMTAPTGPGDMHAGSMMSEEGAYGRPSHEGMPVINELEDAVVAPIAIRPMPELGQSGDGRLVASRAAQFERVAVEGTSGAADAGAKASMRRVAKLTSSAGRSVGNVFRKLTRGGAQAEVWARSWRFGGGARGGTPTAAESASAAFTNVHSPLSLALGCETHGETPQEGRLGGAGSVVSLESRQSGPEAVSARHSSLDGHESEAESLTGGARHQAPPLPHMSLDGPVTLHSLQSKTGEAAPRPRSVRTPWAAASEARAGVLDAAVKKVSAAVEKCPRTVVAVEQGEQREAQGSRSTRPGTSHGKQGLASEQSARGVRAAPASTSSASSSAQQCQSVGKQTRVLRARSGPPASPAVSSVERMRRRAPVDGTRTRISTESSRPRMSAEGSVDTVGSSGKPSPPGGIADTVQRLAQRKQVAPVLSSEQRELQEIERRRLAAAAERTRSHGYWQRTKRAGAAPVTPPRAFLHKPGNPSVDGGAVERHSAEPTGGRSAGNPTGASVRASARPRSACVAQEPRKQPGLARVSARLPAVVPIITPPPAVLSPFGTTTPPMQPPGSARPAHGGSATFAGFLEEELDCAAAQGVEAALMSGRHASTPDATALLPTPPLVSKTPVMWASHHVTAAQEAHVTTGYAEVHLESTRTQGIRLSSGPANSIRPCSDSDEVSASLTPRVPVSFMMSRGDGAAGLRRGPLFPLASGVPQAGPEGVSKCPARGAGPGDLKRGSGGRSTEDRRGCGGSMDSVLATTVPVAAHGTSPLRSRRGGIASQGHGAAAQGRPASSRSIPQKSGLPLVSHAETKSATATARRAQSARPHQGSLTPPATARTRSARSGGMASTAAPTSTSRARTGLSRSPGPVPTRAQPHSPAPRSLSGRHGSVQPAKPASMMASGRRQLATVHGAQPPPGCAPVAASSTNRYGSLRPQSAAAARPGSASADGGSYGAGKAPLSRSCEPGAWRAYQTSNTVPAALRKNPAQERKRTRARVGATAVEAQRPMRHLQPWAPREMDGAATAPRATSRSEQDRQVTVAGSGQQPTLMRTHVPVMRAAPTKPVSPTLATARRSHHSQNRQPASVGAEASAATSRPRSAGAALRTSTQAAPTSVTGRVVQRMAAAAFNAGAPRVARQFAARRGDESAARARSTSAKQSASARSAPRNVSASAAADKADGTLAHTPAAGKGQPSVAHQLRSTSRGAPVATPTIQKPLVTPRLAGEPQPPQPVPSSIAVTAQSTAATPCAAPASRSGAAVDPQPEALSVASSQVRELCTVLSDGSLGPVTGTIEGPEDMVQGKVPSQAGAGSVRSDALLSSDLCMSEVAPVALEPVASVAAPAERIMQRTSFVLNTEVAAAQTQGSGYVAAGDVTVVGPDGSDSGRIVVEDRVGVVSCHDSGTGALNRAAAAAAGVMWSGPLAVTSFGRSGAHGVDARAGSPAAVSPPSCREAFDAAPPAVVAFGAVSRKERSARLSAALPARLSLGPVSSATTAGGTERLQSVLARRRHSKMLRRQSSSGTVSGSLDIVQRTKSRRMSVEPLGMLHSFAGHNAAPGRPLSPSMSLGCDSAALRSPGIPEDLLEDNADAENIPQAV